MNTAKVKLDISEEEEEEEETLDPNFTFLHQYTASIREREKVTCEFWN